MKERGRNVKGIIDRYNKFVKPAFDEYIRPQRRYADIVIPHGSQNKIAIDLVCTNLKKQLDIRNENQKMMSNINKTKYNFLPQEIFNLKTSLPDKVVIPTDAEIQSTLRTIIEDFLNRERGDYHK